MMLRLAILAALMMLGSSACCGAEIQGQAYGDVRLIAPPGTASYLDGGLGKLRFGEDDADPGLKLGEIVGEARLVGETWSLQADGRLNPDYGPAADLIEAFARYAPPASTQWSWSVRAGAFFPPLSLENEQIGWSSFWTITPSAINSWVGAELRTIGGEGTVEWKSNGNDVTLIGALFGWNDPAGVVMADRGWNFDDRVTGLFEKTRLPDATATLLHRTPPLSEHLFSEIDDSPGWYLDFSYEIDGDTGFEVMRYDNQADPTRSRGGEFAWHTSFWDLGFRRQFGAVTFLSQAVSGDTIVRPAPSVFTQTGFRAAYALIGWDLDDVWLAARADVFQTRTRTAASTGSPLSEDGRAFDATASWLPRSWLRLSAEYLLVEDRRAERALEGGRPQQTENQFQLMARVYL